jgi:hypothetical protein
VLVLCLAHRARVGRTSSGVGVLRERGVRVTGRTLFFCAFGDGVVWGVPLSLGGLPSLAMSPKRNGETPK